MTLKKTEKKSGPKYKSNGAFFCFYFITSLQKLFKRFEQSQAHLEYVVILAVVASLTLISLTTFYPHVMGTCENAFQDAANRILGEPQIIRRYSVYVQYWQSGHRVSSNSLTLPADGGRGTYEKNFTNWSSFANVQAECGNWVATWEGPQISQYLPTLPGTYGVNWSAGPVGETTTSTGQFILVLQC